MKTDHIRNPQSLQNLFCYSGEELKSYINGTISSGDRAKIADHLNFEKCPRCRQLFLIVERDGSGKPEEVDHIKQRIKERLKKSGKRDHINPEEATKPVPLNLRQCSLKNRLERGQIWTTSTTPLTMQCQQLDRVEIAVPVLIVDPGSHDKKFANIIRVMPLSFDTVYHSEGETFSLDTERSELSTPISDSVVEIFNGQAMLAGNLGSFRAFLPEEIMEKIEAMEKRYREPSGDSEKELKLLSNQSHQQEQYQRWKEKEISLCQYLNRPVTESLKFKELDVHLSEYKMAADEIGFARVSIRAMVVDNRDFRLLVLQKRERIILRFASQFMTPDKILIDGIASDIDMTGPGEFDIELGMAGYLPEKMTVTLLLDEEEFDFPLRLFR